MKTNDRQQINIVIVGHVDHGKSTVIGRLLADTDSLPQGKLEQVKETCRKNARPFEYAFLLDALKDEQAQGITIDTARCFFKTKKRDYIIIDAPGHIEFLKNMITGAARAEAALLVIDAAEGIQENSKRHGHMIAMLGIKKVTVLVNKMDLIGYKQEVFDDIMINYSEFLKRINVIPISYIPVSARNGDNIAVQSKNMEWYLGRTVLEQLDEFPNEKKQDEIAFRFPVQDIYKFTQDNDDRRIIAGTVVSGSVRVGEKIRFLPSHKKAVIKSIEKFNALAAQKAYAGQAVGFTLQSQVYIKPGEMMVKDEDMTVNLSARFAANIFWVGRVPMIKNKIYKLKLASSRAAVRLVEIRNAIDASDLSTVKNKQELERHDVAECVFETSKPLAFDLATENEETGRFVIIDNYEIAGGGIILENEPTEDSILKQHIRQRENIWEKGAVTYADRTQKQKHKAKFVVLTGAVGTGKREIAKALEKELFNRKFNTYYLGITNIDKGLYSDVFEDSDERIRRLGELARIMTDCGLVFITTIDDADDYDLEALRLLNEPNEILVINVGENNLSRYSVDLQIPKNGNCVADVEKVVDLLKIKEVFLEYYL
ncbi:GTP-binding protein [bacterium]|nr:GTP-binding protein [Candidatus Omnitrophota bacterium]MBU3929313.1 GTP-binding protein [bacterium]MBU4122482.1 GTP-binding protein [bacterium]